MGLDFDALGDKHKALENIQAGVKLIPGIPIIARLDGRAFHTLTRKAKKPYDLRFIHAMRETSTYLLSEFNPDIVYVQSDEITMVWSSMDIFGLKVQKLCSVLASSATAKFNSALSSAIFDMGGILATFDCRVWQVDSLETAAENLMWREWDAYKNSVSMAAHSMFSTSDLEGVSTKGKISLMETKDYHWNKLPMYLKRGSFFKKVNTLRTLTKEELSKIPEKHRPTEPVLRSIITEQFWERLTSISNKSEVIFFGKDPVILEKG